MAALIESSGKITKIPSPPTSHHLVEGERDEPSTLRFSQYTRNPSLDESARSAKTNNSNRFHISPIKFSTGSHNGRSRIRGEVARTRRHQNRLVDGATLAMGSPYPECQELLECAEIFQRGTQTPRSKESNKDRASLAFESPGPEQSPSSGATAKLKEKPLISHHTNLSRQVRCHDAELELGARSQAGSSFKPCRGGVSFRLRAQLQSLRRALDAKSRECVQLRRQVERRREDLGMRTSCEQLLGSECQYQLWKERALAAERKVQVLERFTATLRVIQTSQEHSIAEDVVGDPLPFDDPARSNESKGGESATSGHVDHGFAFALKSGDRDPSNGTAGSDGAESEGGRRDGNLELAGCYVRMRTSSSGTTVVRKLPRRSAMQIREAAQNLLDQMA
jgi:hypothetical protein